MHKVPRKKSSSELYLSVDVCSNNLSYSEGKKQMLHFKAAIIILYMFEPLNEKQLYSHIPSCTQRKNKSL